MPTRSRPRCGLGETEFEKEVWLSGVMLTWGSAGQIVTVDDEPVGFALFAPPTAVPGAAAFPTSPVSPDAVLLTTARILPEFTGQGLARYLMNGVVSALTRRGVRAIEVFGREDRTSDAPTAGGGCRSAELAGGGSARCDDAAPEAGRAMRFRAACYRRGSPGRSVSRTSPRTTVTRGCGSSWAGTSAGRPRWNRRWRSCSR